LAIENKHKIEKAGGNPNKRRKIAPNGEMQTMMSNNFSKGQVTTTDEDFKTKKENRHLMCAQPFQCGVESASEEGICNKSQNASQGNCKKKRQQKTDRAFNASYKKSLQ